MLGVRWQPPTSASGGGWGQGGWGQGLGGREHRGVGGGQGGEGGGAFTNSKSHFVNLSNSF